MLSWFKTNAAARRTAVDLYGVTVAQARRPEFFSHMSAEDSAEGRTSVLIVHLFLVLHRLNGVGTVHASKVGQYLSETYVTDIDDCLREMGVGDLSVPKKVKRAAQAMGERCMSYQKAIDDDRTAAAEAPSKASAGSGTNAHLINELTATVPGLDGSSEGAARFAAYVIEATRVLATQSDDDVLAGKLTFPDVSTQASATAGA